MTFIKLNGPPAGAQGNRKLFKKALILIYKGGDYEKYFRHVTSSYIPKQSMKGFSSTVVAKVTKGSDTVLPCFN